METAPQSPGVVTVVGSPSLSKKVGVLGDDKTGGRRRFAKSRFSRRSFTISTSRVNTARAAFLFFSASTRATAAACLRLSSCRRVWRRWGSAWRAAGPAATESANMTRGRRRGRRPGWNWRKRSMTASTDGWPKE
ncbi:hypothetical protein H6P81_020562 [Aristolochia fimbriata]|uniref:Uncharacterized protein n=1 Tax=Aristolochia fimbriata TaxID=158543 RepID=A0AAV7DZ60_ARIFI|nr:hypothetical protein H6P81_020562 [Aristolochia fimbriata]